MGSAGSAGVPCTPRRTPRVSSGRSREIGCQDLDRPGPGGKGSNRGVGASAVRGRRSPRCGPRPGRPCTSPRGREAASGLAATFTAILAGLALARFGLLRARCSLSEGGPGRSGTRGAGAQQQGENGLGQRNGRSGQETGCDKGLYAGCMGGVPRRERLQSRLSRNVVTHLACGGTWA